MQQERWDHFIHLEVIIITTGMMIRTLWSLLTLGSVAAAITAMAPVQASSTSVGALVVPTAATALASF